MKRGNSPGGEPGGSRCRGMFLFDRAKATVSWAPRLMAPVPGPYTEEPTLCVGFCTALYYWGAVAGHSPAGKKHRIPTRGARLMGPAGPLRTPGASRRSPETVSTLHSDVRLYDPYCPCRPKELTRAPNLKPRPPSRAGPDQSWVIFPVIFFLFYLEFFFLLFWSFFAYFLCKESRSLQRK